MTDNDIYNGQINQFCFNNTDLILVKRQEKLIKIWIFDTNLQFTAGYRFNCLSLVMLLKHFLKKKHFQFANNNNNNNNNK